MGLLKLIVCTVAVKNSEGKYCTDHLTYLYCLFYLCNFDFATLALGILHGTKQPLLNLKSTGKD